MLTASLERTTEYNALFTSFINRAKSGESVLLYQVPAILLHSLPS